MTPGSIAKLTTFAAIRVAGADARNFLQGQLSNDLQQLSRQNMLLACCNSPQGRVQAVLYVFEREDGIWLLLPNALLQPTLERLRKYVLRAKVALTPLSSELKFFWISHNALERRLWPVPTASKRHVEQGPLSILGWPSSDERYLLMQTQFDAQNPFEQAAAGDAEWRLADIRAGLPQVLPETHEMFVAQMLNLDLVAGISFSKGCYTGQEIIARAHYRGAVKRRMLRFSAACPPPAPASRVVSQGAHVGDVVTSAATESGCELLAVISLAQAEASLELANTPGVQWTPLALPYEIPSD